MPVSYVVVAIHQQGVRVKLKTWIIAAVSAALGLTAMCTMLTSPQAKAYQTFDDHVLVGGIWQRTYFLTDSAVANIETASVDSAATWTSAPVATSWRRQGALAGADVIYNWINNTAPDYCAITYLYYGGAYHSDWPTSDWSHTKINIRPTIKQSSLCGSTSHRRGVLAHELGHSMGLAHVMSRPAMLMYAYLADTNVNDPGSDDLAGIQHLY